MESEARAGRAREVRRRDRAVLDGHWMRKLLSASPVGVLAASEDGVPLVNANIFAYDAQRNAIYLHTARVGQTRDVASDEPLVCFVVMEMGRLLPAKTALEFSVEYASVVVYGRLRAVQGEEATNGLERLMEKYAPHLRMGQDYEAISAVELKRTAVYRVDVERWTGKRKQVDADFPGAYAYNRLWSGVLNAPSIGEDQEAAESAST